MYSTSMSSKLISQREATHLCCSFIC